MTTQVKDFIAVAQELWPETGADDWDRPGLSAGDPNAELQKVLLSVDVTKAVVDEAISLGASLVFSHHPYLLKGVTSVSTDTSKGGLLAKVITSGISLFSAHTNADVVEDGVSDTIANLLGLEHIRPLVATGPNIGHGRVGVLEGGLTLGDLVAKLAAILPPTTRGISCSGDPKLTIRKVALCGGAGDAFIAEAAAEADVYITSDLRHHVTAEAGIPLIDVSHWASESLWLQVAKAQLAERLPELDFVTSKINTDPWIFNESRTN